MKIRNVFTKIVGLSIGLSPIWLVIHPSLAISASPTATPSSSPVATVSGDTVKEEIKQRIQDAVNDKLKSAQDDLNKKSLQQRLVGLVGKINDLKQSSFTLTTISDSFQVKYSTQSAVIKDNKPIKTSDLSINDRAIVIGRFNDLNVLDASRIVIVKETAPILKKLVLATIVSIDKTAKTIKVSLDGKEQILMIGKKLIFDYETFKPKSKIAAIILPSSDSKSPSILLKIKSY